MSWSHRSFAGTNTVPNEPPARSPRASRIGSPFGRIDGLVVLHLRPARAAARSPPRPRAFRDPSAGVAVERPAVGRDPGLEAVPGRGTPPRTGCRNVRWRPRASPAGPPGPHRRGAAARRRRRRGRGRDARDDDARDASRRRRDRRLSHASRRHRCSAPCEPTRATERLCRPIRGKGIRVEPKAPHCRAPLTLSRASRPFSKRAREERRDR